ncbi:YfiR family protein [Ekhidna sp.]|uniref:YfiR family protein n=1 Tax=Ekhidna sp. TaxID=2608089 RepID=UPI00329886CD
MRRIIFLITILLISSAGTRLYSQVNKFQALYLINFTKNINWSSDNITIGVVGNTKTLIELESLVAKYPNISLKKIAGTESIDKCQIIFLPSAQSRNFELIQNKIGSLPIILVSEDESLADKGAEIAFYMEGNKLKFILNKSALNSAGVNVGEKLFAIGKVIE